MGLGCEFGCVVLGLIWLEWPSQVCIKVLKEHAFGFEMKMRKRVLKAFFYWNLLLTGQ